jgi:hypothetical protein
MARGGRSGFSILGSMLVALACASTAHADDAPVRKAQVSFDVQSGSYALYERVRVERVLWGKTRRVEEFERLCYSPCEISLPAGTHTLAVATKEGDPIVAPAVTLSEGGHRLSLEYTDNSSTRNLGTGLAMTSGILVALSGAGGYKQAGEDGSNVGLAIIGGLIGTIGIVAGFAMSLTADTAVLQVDSDGESDGERWSVGEHRSTARAETAFGPF